MAAYDFRTPRLFVDAPLSPGASVRLEPHQAHYIVNVLRKAPGDSVLVFNGRDGEWIGSVRKEGRRDVGLDLVEQTRPQPPAGDLDYLFAPLKQARLDYMVQKAVEMGVARLRPVITAHTQVARVNETRMRANAIEAAEQCGVLAVPEIAAPEALPAAVAGLDPERLLVFCDEDAEIADPVATLAPFRDAADPVPVAVLIGPEGGFSEAERKALLAHRRVARLALGPRILRADTAAVAALALVQAVLGDWR